jgi:hypothetical protein
VTSASICLGCGLCCDGTLFEHLALIDESDLGWPLRLLGAEVVVVADPPVLALPCPAVSDGCCTVYDRHRPRACHEFECDLVRAVASGATAPDEARAVIAETVALRDLVRAGGADRSVLDRQVRAHFRASPSPR